MSEGCRISQRLDFVAVFVSAIASFVFATTGFALAITGAQAQSTKLSSGQRNPACGSPAALDDGWTTASPESVGLGGTRLCGIAAQLKQIADDVHAVVIVRHGKLAFAQ